MIIKKAEKKDSKIILDMIKELAKYEKLSNEVSATVADIEKSLFDEKCANVVLIYHLDKPVGFALYFYNFSTFKGKKGLYLEDLFILPDYRGLGFGKTVFEYLIDVAKENNCGRMEWVCLDWNKSAIEFYLKKNAVALSDWTTYRIDESDFEQISCQTITHLLK